MTLTETQKELAEENVGLVHACARRFLGRGVDYEELVGAGSVGLVKAAAGFEPARGFCFSTYAVPSILGEMRRLFREGGGVKLSRGAKEKAAALLKTARTLGDELGREPTVGEIAAKTGDDPSEAAALLAATLPVKSLTTDENDESDLPVPSHEDGVIARLDLRTALTRLTDGERELIALRYRRNLTQSEVGKALGMTQVQVSRAEKRVLMKLRRWME